MALPDSSGFAGMDYADQGLPFIVLAVGGIDASSLDYANQGLPFYIAPSGALPAEVTGTISVQEVGEDVAWGSAEFAPAQGSATQWGASSVLPETTFGTPAGVASEVATGTMHTAWGVAEGRRPSRAASLGVATRIGLHHVAHPQYATQKGRGHTSWGVPTSIRTSKPGRLANAYGFVPASFGAPNAALARGAAAQGAPTGAFGLPGVTETFGAAGAPQAVGWGHPVARGIQRGAGASWTAFGAPTTRASLTVYGRVKGVNFGAARVERSDTYYVWGLNATGRMGRPRATAGPRYAAAGTLHWDSGTPGARHIHRARHSPPESAFGTPLLDRKNTC